MESLAYPGETQTYIERNWQTFKDSEKRASLGKMWFGGILAHQGELEYASRWAVGEPQLHPQFLEGSCTWVLGGRGGLVEGFCLE